MARLILQPHLSEKSTDNIRIFKVAKSANKSELRKAFSKELGLKIGKINIINVSTKKRRRGGQEGWRSGYKKAIVYLTEADTKHG